MQKILRLAPMYHRELGTIDNFAKGIKITLHKRFVDTNSTKWVNYLKQLVGTYNCQEHQSLGENTPKNVVIDTKKHKEFRNLTMTKVSTTIKSLR